jgi:hypothetical protein
VYNYWFFSMFLITLYLNCSLTIVCYISWVAQNLWWIDCHLQTLIRILCFENKIFLTMPYTILDPFLIQKEKLELSLIIVLKNLNFIFKSFYWWGSFVLIFINLKSIRSPRFEFVAWYNLLNHFSNTWISWFVYLDLCFNLWSPWTIFLLCLWTCFIIRLQLLPFSKPLFASCWF